MILRLSSLFFALSFISRALAFVATSTQKVTIQPLKMSSTETFLGAINEAASKALGRKVDLVATSGGGYAGGGGAKTSAVIDKLTDTKYFLKSARGEIEMLRAEYEGVKAMSETGTIQVPTPIAFGEFEPTRQAFVLFEYLNFCAGGSQYELGVQLAKVS